jgi:xanthine dehydrogenase accessory factor
MDIFEEIVAAKKSNQPVVLATVIESLGSAPREEGARMLVRPDGSISGTIGGGAIEQLILKEALAMMQGGAPKVIRHELKDIGMQCGGGMAVFLEPLVPAPQLVIFGAGHIGACLAQIGKMLDFTITVVDNRPEFASPERLPWADRIIAEEYGSAMQKISFTDQSYVVILTHKHAHDFEVLEQCIAKPSCYLGMIGSKAKVAKVFDQLRSNGVSDEIIKKIHSPVGLKIGANTPAEIAISILAEIVQVRSAVNAAGRQSACCNPRA